MAITSSDYFIKFSSNGTIPQIEYALKCAQNYKPIVVVSQKDLIVVAGKKTQIDKLQIRTEKLLYKIQENVYCSITGFPSDVQHILSKIVSVASKLKDEFGFSPSPDVVCKSVADKLQMLIQRTGERISSFSALIFGFDNKGSILYNTDSSAVSYPYYAFSIGNNHMKMNKLLEKNYKTNLSEDKAVEVCCEALVRPLNNDFFPNDLEVFILKKNDDITELTESEINNVISVIQEKE